MNVHDGQKIIALATPTGKGAIGIIRLSGTEVIELVDRYFFGKNLSQVEGHSVHYGKIKKEDGQILDECLATVFRAPRSYTKEDIVELSCHGSHYILQEIIQLFTRNGVRMALPGEFTMRAFLHGQLDLTQAEAVADLIASNSKTQHQLAMDQMRGGFSKMIKSLRKKLIKFASLIELENDFGEEDVEFADRTELIASVDETALVISDLIDSFAMGNAIKEGIPVAIVGQPNVGKSTLLNALLQEDKAIISNIPGTTRDVIEDTIQIEGLIFRFIDTAGIRETQDEIETIGIERTMQQLEKARIVLFLDDIHEEYQDIVARFKALKIKAEQSAIILLTKTDTFHTCHRYDVEEAVSTMTGRTKTIAISATKNEGIDVLKKELVARSVHKDSSQIIISNNRHLQALQETQTALQKVKEGLQNGIPSDLIAIDIRHAMHHLGAISGEISTDDLLDSIFRDFCIGK